MTDKTLTDILKGFGFIAAGTGLAVATVVVVPEALKTIKENSVLQENIYSLGFQSLFFLMSAASFGYMAKGIGKIFGYDIFTKKESYNKTSLDSEKYLN